MRKKNCDRVQIWVDKRFKKAWKNMTNELDCAGTDLSIELSDENSQKEIIGFIKGRKFLRKKLI